jgi:Na+(H+)/acetate symporter ActP
MIDANLIRICKLALVSGSGAFGAAGASFLLHGNLRQATAGVAAGLALATAATLVGAYRRRGPLPASSAATEKKARRSRIALVIAILLANLALLPVRLLHAEWLAAGFGVGAFGFFGLIVSPLFWNRPSLRVKTSPRARMTGVERAVSVRYE